MDYRADSKEKNKLISKLIELLNWLCCKLQGYSVLEYLEAFFTAIIKGRTDYENLMPATIGISKTK